MTAAMTMVPTTAGGKKGREFEVVGCDTGTRYKLTTKASMNIHQLDTAGRTVRMWCVMPAGGLVLGDNLLAQKIAVETMERDTLFIANSLAVPSATAFSRDHTSWTATNELPWRQHVRTEADERTSRSR